MSGVHDQTEASTPSSSLTVFSASAASSEPSSTTSKPLTFTEKKLCKYNGTDSETTFSESELDIIDADDVCEGSGSRILEVSGIQCALQELCCKQCGDGPLTFKEDISCRQGLCTNPYIFCANCQAKIIIPFEKVGNGKTLVMNRKSILTCKSAGDTLANLQMFCAMLDLPQSISKNVYTEHVRATCEEVTSYAQSSMVKARAEVREHYGATSDDDVVDILMSCDGT